MYINVLIFTLAMILCRISFQTNFIKSIYLANDKKPSPKNEQTMNEYSTFGIRMTGLLFVLYSMCAMAFVSIPYLIFMLVHEKEPTLPILVPFIDYGTKRGASITTTYHYGIIFIAVFGLFFCDSLFTNFIISIITMAKLIFNDFIFIGEQLKVPSSSNMKSIRSQLRNTYLMYSEIQRSDNCTLHIYDGSERGL